MERVLSLKGLAKNCPEIKGMKTFPASSPGWKTLQRTSLLKCTPLFSFCYSFYWESRFLSAFQFCLCCCWVSKESVRHEKQYLSAHKCVGVPGQGTSLADLFREKGELTTKCSADNLFSCSCGQKCGQAPSIQELLITCQRALAVFCNCSPCRVRLCQQGKWKEQHSKSFRERAELWLNAICGVSHLGVGLIC